MNVINFYDIVILSTNFEDANQLNQLASSDELKCCFASIKQYLNGFVRLVEYKDIIANV